MKKPVIVFVLAFALTGICYAQSTNDAQRIVGTWTFLGESFLTFYANGTYISTGESLGSGNFIVSNSKIIFNETRSPEKFPNAVIIPYYLSAYGTVLVLELNNGESI